MDTSGAIAALPVAATTFVSSNALPPQNNALHLAPSGRAVVMKTCPICGVKAFLATRKCKGGCGWNFSEKVVEKADGNGVALREQQEQKRRVKQQAPPSVTTTDGSVTTHTNISTEDDGNIDTCIICGDMGMLICCDMCPLSYHADCAGLSQIPSGFWMCPQCTQKNQLAAGNEAGAGGSSSAGLGAYSSNGASSTGGASSQRPLLPATIPLQNGLDPFHQRLNACLDYDNTVTYEIDGYTFMCFQRPDLDLLSHDPKKVEAAQLAQAARIAAAAQLNAEKEAATAAASSASATSAPSTITSAPADDPMQH